MIKKTSYKGLINKVASKNRVSPDLVKSIIEHIFKSIKQSLRMETAPKVLIHNFGTFKTKKTIVESKIKRLKKAYEVGTLSEETYKLELNKFNNILKRLEDEES